MPNHNVGLTPPGGARDRVSARDFAASVVSAYLAAFRASGRTDRRGFVPPVVFVNLCLLAAWALTPSLDVDGLVLTASDPDVLAATVARWALLQATSWAFYVVIYLPMPALYARRLRDLGRSAWWAVAVVGVETVVPVAQPLVDFALACVRSRTRPSASGLSASPSAVSRGRR